MGIFNQKKDCNKELNENALCFNIKQAKQNMNQTSTLVSLNQNCKAVIIGYDKSIDIKTKRRMLELGFVNGKAVTLESSQFWAMFC